MRHLMRRGYTAALLFLLMLPGLVGTQALPTTSTLAAPNYYGIERRDGRWWFVTPNGTPFFSAGIDFVTPTGMEAIDGSNPYREAIEAEFGSNPFNQAAWAAQAKGRLVDWGFNTVGAYSTSTGALAELPATPQLFPLHGGVIPAIRQTNGGGDAYPIMVVSPNDGWDFHRIFVDVYHPIFAQQVDRYLADQLGGRATDPSIIGFFLDNELPFYYRKPGDLLATNANYPDAQTLADSYIALGPSTSGKKAWVQLLRSRYFNDIGLLNSYWGTGFASFDDLLTVNEVANANASQRADKSAFLSDIAETYFRTLQDTFRTYDTHHLILGCRFVALEGIDTPSEVLRVAGQYQSVTSINYYIWDHETYEQRQTRVRTRYAEFARESGRPILNGEFSFGARDSGLPNTRPLGELVDTQAQRAQLYADFARITAEIPEAVGLHWWGYIDPPTQGALNGGEDGNYGAVRSNNVPYAELTQAMGQINPQLAGIHAAASSDFVFPDVPAGSLGANAITELSSRGIIRGYEDGNFGPNDPTLRAQMAALIARAMGWDTEDWNNPFPDQGSVDADLWRNVGTLARYRVAKGYPDGTYNPTGEVLYAQTISFITRAMVFKGYWTQQADNPALYPNVPLDSGHREDLATYVHYAGAVPGTTPTANWATWSQPSTRAWFAEALWQAMTSYFGAP